MNNNHNIISITIMNNIMEDIEVSIYNFIQLVYNNVKLKRWEDEVKK